MTIFIACLALIVAFIALYRVNQILAELREQRQLGSRRPTQPLLEVPPDQERASRAASADTIPDFVVDPSLREESPPGEPADESKSAAIPPVLTPPATPPLVPVAKSTESAESMPRPSWQIWDGILEKTYGRGQTADSQSRSPTSPRISLEERLGAKLPVWIGAIAILLAGIFLMAFAVKQGWFTPRMRAISATAAALAMIVGGCAIRKNYASIAQGLGAAGIGILYAVLLAISTIYFSYFPFATPPFSLTSIVLITAAGVGLSLYLGPMVAIIGLIGGFATPSLLQLGSAHTNPLFLCLIVQQVGISVIGRGRGFWYFSLVALLAVELYVAGWCALYWDPIQAPLLGGVLLVALISFCLSFPLATGDKKVASAAELAWQPIRLAAPVIAALPALLLSAFLIAQADFGWINIAQYGALVVGVMVFARLREPFFALYPIAALLSTLGVVLLGFYSTNMKFGAPDIDLKLRVSVGTLAVLFSLGSLVAMERSQRARSWALFSAVAMVLLAMVPNLVKFPGDSLSAWFWTSVGFTVLSGIAAGRSIVRRNAWTPGDIPAADWLGALCASALLAIVMVVRYGEHSTFWFGVGCGALIILIAFATRQFRLQATQSLLSAMAVIQFGGLLNPWTLSEKLWDHLIWNQLTWGFGSGVTALVVGGCLLAAPTETGKAASVKKQLGQVLQSCGAVLLAIMLCLLVRNGFAREYLAGFQPIWMELGTDFIAIAAVGLILALVARLTNERWRGALGDAFVLVAMFGTTVLTGFLVGPLIVRLDVGPNLIWNWLTYAIGLPVLIGAVSLAVGVTSARSLRYATAASLCAAGIVFLFLQVRHGFFSGPGAMVVRGTASFATCEVPTYAIIVGLVAAGAEYFARRNPSPPMQMTARTLVVVFGVIAFGLVTAFNPLLVSRAVGELPIWNALLYVFGGPLVVAALLAWRFQEDEWPIARCAGIGALALLWLLVTSQVRQWFNGSVLTGSVENQVEWYAYSAAWLVLAIGLLAGGVAARNSVLRWSSLVLMLFTVGKVFLFDTRNLGDLWRVASYFGLGVSLMLVAFVYQRFVFRDARGTTRETP